MTLPAEKKRKITNEVYKRVFQENAKVEKRKDSEKEEAGERKHPDSKKQKPEEINEEPEVVTPTIRTY